MRKKNKRKEPEFKKPFIVLSRNKIAGWLAVIFFLCAWMFILGVLVGRGTAPLKFDIAEVEDPSEVSQADEGDDAAKEPEQKESPAIKDKTTLEFYEALKENEVDTELPALQTPEDDEGQVKAPGGKTLPPPEKKDGAPKATSPKVELQKAVPKKPESQKAPAVNRTNTAGPVYTIQAASVKDPKDADQLVRKLKEGGYPAYRVIGKVPGKGIWFRVRIGEYKGKAEAMRVMDKLKKEGLEPILVMK